MLELSLYALGVMYSPGPVNLHALNMSLKGGFKVTIPFNLGVGVSMFGFFLFFGITGGELINDDVLKYMALIGSGYILYLAYRLYSSQPDIELPDTISDKNRTSFSLFGEGLLMQLLNPKAIVATVPVGTLYFPAMDLSTDQIFMGSAILAILAIWAPGSYALIGHYVGGTIRNPLCFLIFNRSLATLLVWTALSTAWPYLQAFMA
jgi:threonine/homoserine/homoserine lactone efflux protein